MTRCVLGVLIIFVAVFVIAYADDEENAAKTTKRSFLIGLQCWVKDIVCEGYFVASCRLVVKAYEATTSQSNPLSELPPNTGEQLANPDTGIRNDVDGSLPPATNDNRTNGGFNAWSFVALLAISTLIAPGLFIPAMAIVSGMAYRRRHLICESLSGRTFIALIVLVALLTTLNFIPGIILGSVVAHLNWHYDRDAALAVFPTRDAMSRYNSIQLMRWTSLESAIALFFLPLNPHLIRRTSWSLTRQPLIQFQGKIVVQFLTEWMVASIKAAICGVDQGLMSTSVEAYWRYAPFIFSMMYLLETLHCDLWLIGAVNLVMRTAACVQYGQDQFQSPRYSRMLVTVMAALCGFQITGLPPVQQLYLAAPSPS